MSQNKSQTRINQQIRNMLKQPLPYLIATPLQNDIYTWHFTIQGPQNSDFHQGLYHGQILLPFEYPFKPPDMIFMNKNGRFQVNTKICLTITQYHPQDWNPSWTVRTMLEAVISLFNEKVVGIGYQQGSKQMRKQLARKSHSFKCEKCGVLKDLLKPREPLKQQQSKEKIEVKKDNNNNSQVNLQKRNKQDQEYIDKIMKLVQKQDKDKSQGDIFRINNWIVKPQFKQIKLSEQKLEQMKNSKKVQQKRANTIKQDKKPKKQSKKYKNKIHQLQQQSDNRQQYQSEYRPTFKFKPYDNDCIALDKKIAQNCNKLLNIFKTVKITQLK